MRSVRQTPAWFHCSFPSSGFHAASAKLATCFSNPLGTSCCASHKIFTRTRSTLPRSPGTTPPSTHVSFMSLSKSSREAFLVLAVPLQELTGGILSLFLGRLEETCKNWVRTSSSWRSSSYSAAFALYLSLFLLLFVVLPPLSFPFYPSFCFLPLPSWPHASPTTQAARAAHRARYSQGREVHSVNPRVATGEHSHCGQLAEV